ncbi:MAG TPA: helix-turn-helix domain-containing protein [Gemmataceae bacterium]|nr:helix-turn-helix domain-containing protein [Gemmataceae bacterium]
MPRTKKKPEPQSTTPQPVATIAPPSDVLTLAETASYLRLSEADVVRAIHEQNLPARQVGTEWRFLKPAIQQWLSCGKSPLQANKEAWASIIGAWKDDPYLEDMVEEIYRRRGRPITEDGSYRLFHGLNFEKEQK